MDADGTDQTRLTTSADIDTEPTWSPAGNQIAFRSRRTGAFRIHVMGATGTDPDPTPITDGANDAGPTWAPDDSYLAFSRSDDGDAELWLVSREGEYTRLTDNTGITDWEPDWRPVTETTLTDVEDVATGAEFSCALLGNGEVRCWGYGAFGQLGNGGTADSSVPVVVSNPDGTGPLTGVTQLSSGTSHSCALVAGGQVRCWGDNDQGQLGDGTTTDRTRPVSVRNTTGANNLQSVKKVSAGRWHTCVVLDNGQARCWGDNEDGQLGDGTTVDRTLPVSVSNATGGNALQSIGRISAGAWHTCARLTSGQARCWGANVFGALGDGTTTSRTRPVSVTNIAGTASLTAVTAVSAGEYYHSCALVDGDRAVCWGYNVSGQLGDGTTTNRLRPVPVLAVGG